MESPGQARVDGLSPLVTLLRCLECGMPLELRELAERPGYPELGADGWLACSACGERYPVIAGTPRMLSHTAQAQLAADYPRAGINLPNQATLVVPLSKSERTARSFASEWSRFGRPSSDWRKTFLDYMRPLDPAFFPGKLLLDVGTGSGRHSVQAVALGAQVVAVDLGQSIDAARRNLPADALTVQADAERLPFAADQFDLVMSIGVLHHLADTQRALSNLTRFVRPGGHLHVYLCWEPEIGWHRWVLRLVSAARRVTVRMPFSLLHQLCYPLAALLWVFFVLPYRLLRGSPATARLAAGFPLKTYADYPFGVLVNDQFYRFSAPIEQRFTRAQVAVMLARAGVADVQTIANAGWVADGRRPASAPFRHPGISLVITVRNDLAGLRELLPALDRQTRQPDEIIIVDGGSVDGTLTALEGFAPPDTPVRVIHAPGANIAAGRNVGVAEAHYEWIACTDAGCRPEPDWLDALVADLGACDLVGGVFVADGRTEFEQIISLTHYPVPEELDEPSLLVRLSHRFFGRQYLAQRAGGRAMAFHRDIWRATGGFPERQYAGEDQAFAREVADSGFCAALAPDAVVHWRPPGTWAGNARMFFRYCRGDIRSKGRTRHLLRLLAWTAGPAGALRGRRAQRLIVVAGALAYLGLPLRRARRAGLSPASWWRIPVAVAVKDTAQLAGAAVGAVDAVRGVPQPTPHPDPPSAPDRDTAAQSGQQAERVEHVPTH